MKHFLLFYLVPVCLAGQSFWTDDFTDSNFVQNPTWQGVDSVFIVNSNKELQLHASDAGFAYLSTASIASDSANWEFRVKMDFNPSASNYCRIYLISDNQDVTKTQQGYFLSVGGSSSDKISLYRQDGSNTNLVGESAGDLLNLSSLDLKLKVTRDENFNWVTQIDSSGMYKNILMGTDSVQMTSSHFGIACYYTKTRADKFSFDDFIVSGKAFSDPLRPEIDTILMVYKNMVQLKLNENVTKISAEVLGNYELLPSAQNPMLAVRDSINSNWVELSFANPFNFGTEYRLVVDGVEDNFGNSSADTSEIFKVINPPPKAVAIKIIEADSLHISFEKPVTIFTAEDNLNYFISNGLGFPISCELNTGENVVILKLASALSDSVYYQIQIKGVEDTLGYESDDTLNFWFYTSRFGDVVINELMIDPEPVVGSLANRLPAAEYIELFNRAPFSINLSDWSLDIGGKLLELPFYELNPGAFVVLLSDDVQPDFPYTLDFIQIPLSASELSNSAEELFLFSNGGTLINSISYNSDWFSHENKSEGGWSLEKIDPDWICEEAENWTFSSNTLGGTPGRKNSQFATKTNLSRPMFQYCSVNETNTISLHFSKGIDAELALNPSSYQIEPILAIDSIYFNNAERRDIVVRFSKPMDSAEVYRMSFTSPWLSCHQLEFKTDTIRFGLPERPEKGDVLLNEILFNPPTGGADFVELYNLSNKIFDIGQLYLGNWDNSMQTATNTSRVSENSRLFEPQQYLVFTEDTSFINSNYHLENPQHLIEVADVPSMDDNEGNICIANGLFEVIDYFEYLEDYHHSVLNSVEGLSLERVSAGSATNTRDNWQSASTLSGFATPTYENSQNFVPNAVKNFGVEPKLFSPNQDGLDDFTTLSYSFDKSNYTISVSIYNTEGNKLKVLANNEISPQEGWVKWDGTDEDSNILRSGVYIALLEYFNEDGENGSLKKVCVLSR